jgi:DNA-binding winged helix-turn-helix (wHTH) protein
MSMSVLSVPEVRSERHDHPSGTVVTITVQITLSGDELPPAAARLIGDLEALVGGESEPAPPPLRLVGEGDEPARVRRVGQAGAEAPRLYLHTGSRTLLLDGVPVQLTRREFDLFQFLCENPRRVFNRAQLLRQVWGYDMVGTERTVDVHIRRLRVKLGDCASIITTVRGVGYRLDDDAPVDIVVHDE